MSVGLREVTRKHCVRFLGVIFFCGAERCAAIEDEGSQRMEYCVAPVVGEEKQSTLFGHCSFINGVSTG